jgi:hypothetical protein
MGKLLIDTEMSWAILEFIEFAREGLGVTRIGARNAARAK